MPAYRLIALLPLALLPLTAPRLPLIAPVVLTSAVPGPCIAHDTILHRLPSPASKATIASVGGHRSTRDRRRRVPFCGSAVRRLPA